MLSTQINNSQNFKARIRMNKPDYKKIAATTGLVTAGAASLVAQADFDLGCAGTAVVASNQANEPSYKGTTLPLVSKLIAANKEYNDWLDSSAVLSGATGFVAFCSQLVGSVGYNILNKISGNKLSKTYDDIYYNLGKDGREGLTVSNLAMSAETGLFASNGALADEENLAMLGTTASTVGVSNTVTIAKALDKTNSNDKILPS